jgi:hypothetical protein
MIIRKRQLLITCAVLLLGACNHTPHPEDAAAQAAKECYDLLLEGRYDEFVSRQASTDSLPSVWREELVDNMKMFAFQMQQEHKGMKEVRIVRATADTAAHTAQVFLSICFGDSTVEETVIPMVEKHGEWFLK